MTDILYAIAAAAGVLLTYHAGKLNERRRIHRWLRFLHLEVKETELSPLQLSAMIAVGQHYEWEKD